MISARARALVAGLFFAGAGPVLAASPGPRVVVVSVPLDAPSRAQAGLLEHAGEAAIRRANRFSLVPVPDAFDPQARAARERALVLGTQRVGEGQRALDELDTLTATLALTEALGLLRQTNTVGEFSSLIGAWVLKAASEATAGENAPARQDIERIVALDPKVEFPKHLIPPELLEFAEAQRRIARNAKGELTVRTEPPGAAVWVDGQYRGTSPALVQNLMSGRHLVSAALGGYSLGQEELTLGEGLVTLKAAPLQGALMAAREAIARNPEGLMREQSAISLGRALGAEQILLLIAKKSLAGEQLDLTAMRIEVADGHNWALQTAVVPMSDETTINGVLDVVMSTDAPREGQKAVFHVAGENAAGPGLSGKRSAGITLLVAGAALIGAGLFSGLAAESAAAQFRVTPQVETGVGAALSMRGRTFAILADVSFVLAAGSVALGSIFVATGGRHPVSGAQHAAAVAEPAPAASVDGVAPEAAGAKKHR